MGKLYEKYLELKKKDENKYYLFKNGNFYIFLADDAKNINKITTLKLTNLNNNVLKCGFPINSLEKYMEIFNNLKLKIEKVEKTNDNDEIYKIVKKLKKIDVNNITPLKALDLLKELKDMIDV